MTTYELSTDLSADEDVIPHERDVRISNLMKAAWELIYDSPETPERKSRNTLPAFARSAETRIELNDIEGYAKIKRTRTESGQVMSISFMPILPYRGWFRRRAKGKHERYDLYSEPESAEVTTLTPFVQTPRGLKYKNAKATVKEKPFSEGTLGRIWKIIGNSRQSLGMPEVSDG